LPCADLRRRLGALVVTLVGHLLFAAALLFAVGAIISTFREAL
jgi:hypothetical protein